MGSEATVFYYATAGGFLLLALEDGKCETGCHPSTPRAPPATTGNQTGQHIQPMGKKKYEQNSAKRILIGQQARRINWRGDKGH